MKTTLLMSLILFAGLNVKAGNEGAQAAPPMPATVLAEMTVSGGMPGPPGSPRAERYQVLSDGTERAVTEFGPAAPTKIRILKTMEVEELEQFDALVDSIQVGKLTDPNPDRPPCEDAPTITDLVNNSKGQILIGQTVACKPMKKGNETAADEAVIKVLSDLAQLAESEPQPATNN